MKIKQQFMINSFAIFIRVIIFFEHHFTAVMFAVIKWFSVPGSTLIYCSKFWSQIIQISNWLAVACNVSMESVLLTSQSRFKTSLSAINMHTRLHVCTLEWSCITMVYMCIIFTINCLFQSNNSSFYFDTLLLVSLCLSGMDNLLLCQLQKLIFLVIG